MFVSKKFKAEGSIFLALLKDGETSKQILVSAKNWTSLRLGMVSYKLGKYRFRPYY
jgi:hypothetical protein